MKLWTSLTGLIQAELLTADPAGALCAIADAGIALRDVTPEGAPAGKSYRTCLPPWSGTAFSSLRIS